MKIVNNRKGVFKAGSALQALSLLGAGIVATTAIATPAMAQDYTNVTAAGRVLDGSGNPISGATVTLTSESQGFVRTSVTDSDGSYRIAALPQGSYTFMITAPSFANYSESGVVLSQSQSGNSFQLVTEGTAGDATGAGGIVVVGSRIRVADFERTTTGAVIDVGDLATRVPVGRDLNSIIQLAPGTAVGDTTFGSLSSVAGSSVSENVFYVNGLNITEFRQGLGAVTVPFDFYETVEVKNGGYQAEFGRATGGFVNAITKSGSNDYHGSITFNWEPDDLSSDSPNTLFSDNDADYSERVEMIAQLSGPIIKDRLFFYGFYNTRNVESQDSFTTPTFNQATGELVRISGTTTQNNKTTSPFYGGKIDAIITDGHRLEFTYFNVSGSSDLNVYGQAGRDPYDYTTNTPGGFSTKQTSLYGGENYVGRYTGQFTNWLTLSAAYGKNKNRASSTSSNNAYPFISDTRSGSPVSVGNPVNVLNLANDEREFYRADVDLFFNLIGTHHVRAGYDREDLTSDNATVYTGGVAYTYFTAGAGDPFGVPQGQNYLSARTFVTGGLFKSRNEAYYIQDSWSLLNDRLTLQFGVRNDRFNNRNVAGELYYDSGDNWAPRVSFTADPMGDGRTKVYGSFGRYFLPIATNTNIRLGGAELDYDAYFLLNGTNADNTPIIGAPVLYPSAGNCPGTSTANCTLRNDGSVAPLDSIVAANLQNQSVDEYILGAERRLGSRIKVGIYGTYRSLNASLEDAAIDAGINAYCDDNGITGCDAIWYGAHQYALFNPGNEIVITTSDPLPGDTAPSVITLSPEQLGYPAAKRTYKAITATFDREFDGEWSLAASYTYSENKGNIEGGVKSDNGQRDSGLTTDYDFPSLALGAYGFLPNDRRHSFKAYGSYKVSDWLTVGGNFVATAPRKFGCNGRTANSVSAPGLNSDYGWAYGASARFCYLDSDGKVITSTNGLQPGQDRVLVPRGTAFESDWLTQTNLELQFTLPTTAFDSSFRVSVFNVFNEKAKLDFVENGTNGSGTPRTDYGQVTSYQSPRYVRLQLRIGF